MANNTQKNKIANINLSDETHQAIKKWAEYQGTTMPKLAQALLEDMQPMLVQLIDTYEEIMAGNDREKALNKLLAKGLTLAAERLTQEDKDEK
jgi:hypothetical protein